MCCGRSPLSSQSPTPRFQQQYTPYIGDCDYTISQLQAWAQKLICCKDKGLYLQLGLNAQTMNKYLGTTLSAINNPSNPCYYKATLDLVADFIIMINNTNQC